jgi:apolipoprotein N-acyltransferase
MDPIYLYAFWQLGAAAYTQMDHIVLLQSLSLFGMAGLSFLIYWVNMAIFSFIVDEHNRLKKLMLPAIVLLVVLTFGALRYDLGKAKSNITIKAAAIGTDSRVGTGLITY